MQPDFKLWPFKVTSGPGDRPMVVVIFQGEGERFHPEGVSSRMLLKMKGAAEADLGSGINDAVVIVPAW